MPFRPADVLVPAQVMVAVGAIVVLTMWPPSSGEMMLVPLADRDTSRVARIALEGGARLLGSGPFAGSLIVVGQRFRIERNIPGSYVVVMAAPPAGCGFDRTVRRDI